MLVDMRTLNTLIGMKGKRKSVPGTAERMLGRLEGLLKGKTAFPYSKDCGRRVMIRAFIDTNVLSMCGSRKSILEHQDHSGRPHFGFLNSSRKVTLRV